MRTRKLEMSDLMTALKFRRPIMVAATPSGVAAVARHGGHGISVFDLDLENLAARRTETMVRNVQRAVGSKGEAGGKEEGIVGRAVDQDLLLAVGQYANKTTRCRYGTWGTR